MTTTESPTPHPDRLTAEQKALLHQRQGIELSRRRVIHDLETSTSPMYRRNLEAGLAFLEERIAEVDRALIDLERKPRSSRAPKLSVQRRKTRNA
ncbi:MAG: hypothetical protein ACRD2J_14270 [Thermoanaerobaculia bacterium]